MKLLYAFSIVYMHTYCHDLGTVGDFVLRVISSAGVPFFFICSGFFYKKGLNRNSTSGKFTYFKHYYCRVLYMYLSWTFITFPIAVYLIIRAYPDSSVVFKVIYWIRMFCLSGSIGIYWYLLALIICSCIVYIAEKYNRIIPLILVSIVFFIWGQLYNSRLNTGQLYYEWIHVLFGSTRNFLNTGLFYMMIGYLLAKYEHEQFLRSTIPILIFVVSIIIRIIEIKYFPTSIAVVIVAMASFILAQSRCFTLSTMTSVKMRQLSIGIYCIHFPFILLFDYALKKGTFVDFPITLVSAIVFFYLLLGVLSPKYSSLLFGS